MGQTSSNSADTESAAPTKSHYELLDLPPSASDEDIKKAYRRKALELHPDRNYGKEADATALFAEIQAAYSVLSDPQERAWYDAHQAEFLSGGDTGEAHYERSVKVTTAEDIRAMCASRSSAFSDFSDGPNGFFTNVRELFERLSMEEGIASANGGWDPLDFPSFGSSNDEFQDVVKTFYSVWGGFSTAKTFAWKDLYRPSADHDRRTRRAMEKENQKARDEAIREFNDAVRALVLFVRRRDPRYVATATTDAERQKTLREAAAAQAARARQVNAERVAGQAIPDWARSRGDGEEDDYAAEYDDEFEQEEAEEDPEIWECVVCEKTFKSEGQYDAHERSKKHKQALFKLKREMRDQNIELGLEPDETEHLSTEVDVDELQKDVDKDLTIDDTLTPEATENGRVEPAASMPDQHSTRPSSDSEEDDSYASRSKVESRLLGEKTVPVSIAPSTSDHDDPGTGVSTPSRKLGKAKEKRAKRAAKEAAAIANESEVVQCVACEEDFASKNKLFDHIKRTGHARPVESDGKKGKRR